MTAVEPRFAPAVRERLVDVAFTSLRKRILDGSLPMGFHLREVQLASEMQMSRGPVRLAVERLVEEGLVVERPHHGAVVREFDAATLVELYNIRLGLERIAVRLATRVRMDTTGLHDLVDQLELAVRGGDELRVAELEAIFHGEVCAGSRNEMLSTLYLRISGQIQMAIRLVHAGLPVTEQVVAEYRDIIAAIESGDEREAAEAMQTNILASIEAAVVALGGDTRYLLSRVVAGQEQ